MTNNTEQQEPTLQFMPCAGASKESPHGPADAQTHRVAYWDWQSGDTTQPAQHLVLCVHGLTRTGRDFDELARHMLRALPGRVRVVCPDVAGRGRSDWLADANQYQIPFYVGDMVQLLQFLASQAQQAGTPIQRLDWIGSSMGGLIGMGYSALPMPPLPIHSLVLNDIGPALEAEALERINDYLGKMPRFDTVDEGADYLRTIAAGFGPHSRAQWLTLSQSQLRPLENGQFTLHYDPEVASPVQNMGPQVLTASQELLWQIYDAITARTLLLRGQESDLLSAATAQAMQQRGPRARLAEFEGVGHAPTLVDAAQRDVVMDFLQQDGSPPPELA